MTKKHDYLMQAILDARLHDPFSYLGLHQEDGGWILRIFLPHGQTPEVQTTAGWTPFTRLHEHGIYSYRSEKPLLQPCPIACLPTLE